MGRIWRQDVLSTKFLVPLLARYQDCLSARSYEVARRCSGVLKMTNVKAMSSQVVCSTSCEATRHHDEGVKHTTAG